MILVDTSVWVNHFRRTDARLVQLLEDGEVMTHPLVIGELACGKLPRRREVLDLFHQLEAAPIAADDEALAFIERHRLMGRGIGYVDVHLLASSLMTSEVELWTMNKRLAAVASAFGVGSPLGG